MKFAVIKTGGKQYIVSKDDVLDVEKLDKKEKDAVEFKDVLCIADGDKVEVGKPTLKGKTVKGEVVKEYKDDKIVGVKYKSKKRYRRKFGHRQNYTQVKITSV
ncbi:50S ribosomal protein L21 [Patescibacteria group bacterium]|nr:50S ribosomal protein L21 [Patescibacteria group bacterium]